MAELIKQNIAHKEMYARFFEAPTRESLRELLKNHVGETEDCDFKREWPTHDNLARHILGFANTLPSVIIIGVEENKTDRALSSVGLTKLSDKAKIIKGLRNYLPSDLLEQLIILDFNFNETEYGIIKGKSFQVLMIEYKSEKIPFVSLKDGTDIKASTIYVRRPGETVIASQDELQRVLNKRIESGYSTTATLDLKQHIDQLRMLDGAVPKFVPSGLMNNLVGMGSLDKLLNDKNPKRPKEEVDDFLIRMLEIKKIQIQKLVSSK